MGELGEQRVHLGNSSRRGTESRGAAGHGWRCGGVDGEESGKTRWTRSWRVLGAVQGARIIGQ